MSVDNVTVSLCGSGDFGGVGDIVSQWAHDIAVEDVEQLRKNVRKAATVCRKEIRKGCPDGSGPWFHDLSLSGKYLAGWSIRTRVRGGQFGDFTAYVYNKSKPGLTHLLEKGHAKWLWGHPTGDRVPAYPHIAPAYEVAKRVLDK